MAQIKVIFQGTQTATAVTGTTFGSAVSLQGALTVCAQPTLSSLSSVSGATAIFQVSADAENVTPSNWDDYGSAQNITVSGSLFFEKANPSGNWIRVKFGILSGSFNSSTTFVVKGPN